MSTDSLDTAIASLTIQDGFVLCKPKYYPGNGAGKFYVVLVGRRLGVFREWETVKPFVVGFYGSRHKSFTTLPDAHEYWYEYCRTAHSHPAAIPPPYLSTDYSTLQSPSTLLTSVPTHAPARQVFYIVRPINLQLPGASLYSNRSTALAALVDAGDSWELLGKEGLERAEQEVLRSA